MNRLPDVLIDKVVSLDDYLKKIDCDPFFYLSKNTSITEVSLDNPEKPKMPVRTDCL